MIPLSLKIFFSPNTLQDVSFVPPAVPTSHTVINKTQHRSKGSDMCGTQPAQNHLVMPHRVAGPGWSAKDTRQTSFRPAHTREDAKCRYFTKQTHPKNCLLRFGSWMPPVRASNFIPGVRWRVWRSWVALTGAAPPPSPATVWRSQPLAAKPSIWLTHTHNTLLPWFCLCTLGCLSSTKAILWIFYFFPPIWAGRGWQQQTGTHTHRGRSDGKGSYWGKGVQGLTVVVLPSVTSTTATTIKNK